MKKHCSEGKHGFKTEWIRNKFLPLFFFASVIIAQVPINGFFQFKQHDTKPLQKKISGLDFNRDGYRDVIVFNKLDKKYFIQQWNKDQFQKPLERQFPSSIYELVNLEGDGQKEKQLAFISRNNREAGISVLSKTGTINLRTKIKFDSYPSSIDVGDINKDRKDELLISGSAFNGLTILRQEKGKLVELRVDEKNLYSTSWFIDLDFDGYKDVAAFNLIKNSLIFFYNDQTGSFSETRSIGFNGNIFEPFFYDINSDGYSDFIFVNEKQFEVFLGDSVSSFNKKIFISAGDSPSKYTVLDFNGDGYNDIAFINSENGKLCVLFARGNNKFFPPIVYFERNGIVDLVSFVDRGGKKIFVLDENGKIYVINKFSLEDNSSITLASEPTLIGSFDLLNDKKHDLFFVDDKNARIVFLSSKKMLFDTFHEFRLSRNHSNFVVDDIKRDIKTFYFYSKGENVIELLRVDFPRMEKTKRILYSKGAITDLKITSDRLKDRQTIFILSRNNNKLFLESFDFRDFRYLNTGVDEIAVNFDDASLLLDVYKEIYFSSESDDNFLITKATFNRKILGSEVIVKVPANKNSKSFVKCFEDHDINENLSTGLLTSDNNSELLLINRKKYLKYSLEKFVPEFQRIFYQDNEKENSLYLYDKAIGRIKKITIENISGKVEAKDIFEQKGINHYIVDRLNNKKEYLIFSNSTENLIDLKNLK